MGLEVAMGSRGGEAGHLPGRKIHGESERTSRLGNLSCLCAVLGLCIRLLLAGVMLLASGMDCC